MAINCGVIAVRVLRGLALPNQRRDHTFSASNVAEYMSHVTTLGCNRAISHVACRQWRFQDALCLLDWAVAQEQHGQVARVLAMDVQ